MNTLIWVEHDNASVKDATLAVVTAAAKLGDVTALVAGSGCDGAAQAAAQIAGVSKVLKADDAAYANELAENVAPLVAGLMANYDAFLAPATSTERISLICITSSSAAMRGATFLPVVVAGARKAS